MPNSDATLSLFGRSSASSPTILYPSSFIPLTSARYLPASNTHRPQSRGVSWASLGTSLVMAVALLLQ